MVYACKCNSNSQYTQYSSQHENLVCFVLTINELMSIVSKPPFQRNRWKHTSNVQIKRSVMFPCSGFSYQYMNYIVEFFLSLKCWTDWYKKQSTKSKTYACVITGQISQSLSKTLANIAILCFRKQISNWTHSIVKCWTCDNIKIFQDIYVEIKQFWSFNKWSLV